MTDIVERLRICAAYDPDQKEAADTIEALRAENAKLRKALRPFATAKVNRMFPQSPMYHLDYLEKDGDPFENAIAVLGDTDG